jgi:hypothetical protein
MSIAALKLKIQVQGDRPYGAVKIDQTPIADTLHPTLAL